MLFMNEWDIETAIGRFERANTPNRLLVAQTIGRLADWTNRNSDGWAYWPKPCRAAAKAIDLVRSYTYEENLRQEETDATDAEVKAAFAPIKGFLTKCGIDGGHDAVFPDPGGSDLPVGYRWATAEESEWYCSRPAGVSPSNFIVVRRTVDSAGRPYTQDEADLAVAVN